MLLRDALLPRRAAGGAWINEARYGRIVEVRAALLHSSDLDPGKTINWKRQARYNGEYGALGDLGMHVLHLPLRAGWAPTGVHAILSDIFTERPDTSGTLVPCDTPENAVLLCDVACDGYTFPMQLATKRVAPGETNTWLIEIDGTKGSIAFRQDAEDAALDGVHPRQCAAAANPNPP